MKIIIVTFTAFARKGQREVFIEKTYEQVHDRLTDICNTYIVESIIEAHDGTFQPLNSLTKFITEP